MAGQHSASAAPALPRQPPHRTHTGTHSLHPAPPALPTPTLLRRRLPLPLQHFALHLGRQGCQQARPLSLQARDVLPLQPPRCNMFEVQ